MSHSYRSPSKSHMWMHCHGALAQPENQQGEQSSTFADNGTASHTLGAWALETGKDCHEYPHGFVPVNGAQYAVDEERCDFVQSYVDDVRRRAMGGVLFVEHRVDLSKYLGNEACQECNGSGQQMVDLGNGNVDCEDCHKCDGTGEVPQGGTADAVIILPKKKLLIGEDLKYGTGEKVYASYEHNGKRLINTQCGNYLLGLLDDAELLGYEIETAIAVIHQPRLGHIDEFEIGVAELREFGERVKKAVELGDEALVLGPKSPKFKEYLHPDKHTCRWCSAVANCEKRTQQVQDEVRMDFETMEETLEGPPVPTTEHLTRAFAVLPMIEQWVKATKAALWQGVLARNVVGPDGEPLKFVAGKGGKRFWHKDKLIEAEGMMVGVVGPDAYQPQQMITAPAFEGLLKKKLKATLKGKAFEAMWDKTYGPLIDNAKPSITIALGSDPRPAYGAADASEFADEEIDITE